MFVLHVGPHKTATTWLQANFHANAAALERAGWHYPLTGERVRIAHHDISDKPWDVLDDDSTLVAELRGIARRAEEAGLNILLSSEGFRNWRPGQLQRLRQIFAPHEMRIVYTLRDPVSMFHSFWAQQVKTGRQSSLPDYFERQRAKARRSRVFSINAELAALADLDGIGLTLLAYDEIRRRNLDILDVFTSEILGIADLPHVGAGALNEREPLELTEFMRLMVIRAGRWRGGDQVNIGRIFQHMLTSAKKAEIVTAVAACGAAKRTFSVDRDQPFFREIETALLADHAERIVPKPSGRLFLGGEAVFDHYDSDVLAADPAVARLLDELSGKFRPDGLRMRAASFARAALIRWRQWRKRLI